MTPKEKASELFNKFKLDPIKPMCIMHYEHSKQCALIAVNEIIDVIEDEREGFNWKDYYKEVKEEIEKL